MITESHSTIAGTSKVKKDKKNNKLFLSYHNTLQKYVCVTHTVTFL